MPVAPQLRQYVRLHHRIAIYVPSTTEIDRPTNNAAQVEETARFLSRLFGGATSTPACGYWLSENAGLVTENTVIVYAYAHEDALTQHLEAVLRHCLAIKQLMGQEAVSIEIDGEMYLI